MARLGKTTESPLKYAAKKAKRAAAKANQDLEEEFASEVPRTNKPEPVAVDAIPAQIPKKTNAVPASSLAPLSPTAEDTQDRTYEPSNTITITSRSFAPPPLQDSACGALSIPMIRSRMNYDTIPIEYAYLIDV